VPDTLGPQSSVIFRCFQVFTEAQSAAEIGGFAANGLC